MSDFLEEYGSVIAATITGLLLVGIIADTMTGGHVIGPVIQKAFMILMPYE